MKSPDLISSVEDFAARSGQSVLIVSHKLFNDGKTGSGNLTIANPIGKALYKRGHHMCTLDDDSVGHGLNRGRGFNNGDRIRNFN